MLNTTFYVRYEGPFPLPPTVIPSPILCRVWYSFPTAGWTGGKVSSLHGYQSGAPPGLDTIALTLVLTFISKFKLHTLINQNFFK